MVCIYGVLQGEPRKCHNCGFCEGFIVDEHMPNEACLAARLACTRKPLRVCVTNTVQLMMAHMINDYNKSH
jgi:hypothetical protein